MYYIKMRPDEIRNAVERNIPVIMAAGCVEYHGPHLPVGTDYLIAETVVERVEKQCECIVMPPLPFSSTMFWAGGPDDGEFDFDPEALRIYAKEILKGLVKVGFKRIYILQHHQGEGGLPALTLRRACVEVLREMTHQWGEAWGRLPDDKLPNPDLFGMFQVAYVDSFSGYPSATAERIPIGHGGKGETQLIMAGYPETVKMDELDKYRKEHGCLPSWLQDSHLGTREEGERWIEFCVQGWVRELSR